MNQAILTKLPETLEEFNAFVRKHTWQVYITTGFVLIGKDELDFHQIEQQLKLIEEWLTSHEGFVIPSDENPDIPFESTNRFAGFTKHAQESLLLASKLYEWYILAYQKSYKQEEIEIDGNKIIKHIFFMREIVRYISNAVKEIILAATEVPEIANAKT